MRVIIQVYWEQRAYIQKTSDALMEQKSDIVYERDINNCVFVMNHSLVSSFWHHTMSCD